MHHSTRWLAVCGVTITMTLTLAGCDGGHHAHDAGHDQGHDHAHDAAQTTLAASIYVESNSTAVAPRPLGSVEIEGEESDRNPPRHAEAPSGA